MTSSTFFGALDEMTNTVEVSITVTAGSAAGFFEAVQLATEHFGAPTRIGEGATHMEAHFAPLGFLVVRARHELIEELREAPTLTDIVKQRLNQGDQQ